MYYIEFIHIKAFAVSLTWHIYVLSHFTLLTIKISAALEVLKFYSRQCYKAIYIISYYAIKFK